jgi:hypothetical protein
MQVQGTTTGSIKSVALTITGTLTAFTLYNKTGGAIVCSVGIVTSDTSTDRYLFNFNLAAVGTATSSAYQETKIAIPTGTKVLIVTSGEIDYLLQID